jgi:hypothetical protein
MLKNNNNKINFEEKQQYQKIFLILTAEHIGIIFFKLWLASSIKTLLFVFIFMRY